MNININVKGLKIFNNPELKSTKERMSREEKRDRQVAFYEHQKEGLKNMKADTLEDIAKKLELLNGYNEGITAAKQEFNHSQMFHTMDEAIEKGEKIAKAVEKSEPKTPEERKKEAIKEAAGIEESGGMLSEILDEVEEIEETLKKTTDEEIEESLEDELLDEITEEEILSEEEQIHSDMHEKTGVEDGRIIKTYKRFDQRV